MDILFVGYEILLFICCIITLAIAIYSYNHKKGLLSKSLCKLSLTSFLFSFVLILAILINNSEISLFFVSLQFAIFTAACSIWAVLILRFLKVNENKFENYIWVVYIFPIILIICSFINLVYPVLIRGDTFYSMRVGPIGFIVYFYTLILTFLILYILILYFKKINSHEKKSILIMFILPSCTSIPSFVTFGNPFYEFSVTTITFSVGIVFLFYCMYLTNLMNITPNIDKKIIDNINVGMVFFDLNGKLVEYNTMLAKLFNLDESVIGISINEIINKIDYPKDIIDFYYNTEIKSKEFQINDKLWVDISRHEVYDNKEHLGCLFTIYNISKLKAAEIKALKAEKEFNKHSNRLDNRNKDIVILLQEVHHRVKNNLQLILSFINLDRRFNNQEEEILKKTINRISSLSVIYQSSYKQGNYSSINIGDILFEIAENLRKQHSLKNLTINYNIDKDIIVKMDIISPLGLIFNELVSNAIIHAFDQDKMDKLINISVEKIDNNKAYILIEDNGKGLPTEIDLESPKSLGFIIIKSLTEQIRGKFDIIVCDGTAFRLEFPIGDD